MTKTVICMKWGERYPAHFANRLYNMVRRNVTGDLRFVCFTDDKEGLLPEVEYQPLPPIELPEKYRWWPWRKISLWQAGLGGLEGEVLFLDVDLIVTGNMDPFWEFHPGEMCIAENWTQKAWVSETPLSTNGQLVSTQRSSRNTCVTISRSTLSFAQASNTYRQ